MVLYKAKVKSHKEIVPNIFKMKLEAAEIAGIVNPGQFIQLYLPNGKNMLARPFSISSVSDDDVTICCPSRKTQKNDTQNAKNPSNFAFCVSEKLRFKKKSAC